LSLATAIFVAAIAVWRRADSSATLVATLAFVAALLFTAGSMFYSGRRQGVLADTFFYVQVIFDLFLVTTVVHLTQTGTPSQLAPLYILVIAVSALVLPPAGVLLVAGLGDVLYFAVTIFDQARAFDLPVLIQLGIFGAVALGCGYIGARLRQAHAGREEMAAELAAFRLREADIERLHTRAERLEAVAELSASLAHEIKNPLASIRSATELLAKVPGADDDTRTLTTLVQRESDRLSRLLSEFLDFARTGVTSVRRVDLVDIAHHAAALVSAHPDKPENVTIRELFPSTPLVVVGDDDLLHRAIFNLLLNAVQASPPGGEVRLEAAELPYHQPREAAHHCHARDKTHLERLGVEYTYGVCHRELRLRVSNRGVPERLDLVVDLHEFRWNLNVVRQTPPNVRVQDGAAIGDNREPNQVRAGINHRGTFLLASNREVQCMLSLAEVRPVAR